MSNSSGSDPLEADNEARFALSIVVPVYKGADSVR